MTTGRVAALLVLLATPPPADAIEVGADYTAPSYAEAGERSLTVESDAAAAADGPDAMTDEEPIGGPASCREPGCVEVPQGFSFCRHPTSAQNWAVLNSACTQIWGVHDGGIDRVQDRYGFIRVMTQVPPRPSSARVSVLVNRAYAKMTVGVRVYKTTTGGLLGELVDYKIWHMRPPTVLPSSYLESKHKYCLAEDCGARWSATSAQFLDMQAWVRSAVQREITVIVTVYAWYAETDTGLYLPEHPHSEFEYRFNAPILPGGCEIGPATRSAYFILLPILMLVMVRSRRSYLLPVVLLLVPAAADASMNFVTTNAGVSSVLKTLVRDANPNALPAFMATVMAAEGTVAGTMDEGTFVVQGTKVHTGSGDACTFPHVTLAATNLLDGPEEAVRLPLSFVTDDTCRVTASFLGNEDPSDVPEAPSDSEHLVTMEGNTAGLSQSCVRPFRCFWAHYNRSPLMFPTSPFVDWNVPWPGDLIGVAMPEWWQRYLRTPQTEMAIWGNVLDLGDHFEFPSQPGQSINGATWLSWNTFPNPGGVPWLRYTVTPDRYEVIGQVNFRMDGNFYSSFAFDPPAGYPHEFFLAVVMFPAGKMNIVVDFSGTFPLFPFAMEGVFPRFPYLPLTSFRCSYEVSGPDCPWSRPYPMQFACTPPQFEGFSPQCRHYVNY